MIESDYDEFKKFQEPTEPQAKYDRMEHAQVAAKKRGCMIVLPKANELFLDIDSEEKWKFFESQLEKMERVVGLLPYIRTQSPSHRPGRYHVKVLFPRDLQNLERVCLQAVLGSDLVRERLSYERILTGAENPVLFFEKDVPEINAFGDHFD